MKLRVLINAFRLGYVGAIVAALLPLTRWQQIRREDAKLVAVEATVLAFERHPHPPFSALGGVSGYDSFQITCAYEVKGVRFVGTPQWHQESPREVHTGQRITVFVDSSHPASFVLKRQTVSWQGSLCLAAGTLVFALLLEGLLARRLLHEASRPPP